MPCAAGLGAQPARLGILADIHGNVQALTAVLADMARLGVDRMVCLGDHIGYGPEPEEVVRTLIAHEPRIVAVAGNHELALVDWRHRVRLHAAARDSLAITRTLLSPGSLAWLTRLPRVHCHDGARYVHGCPPRSTTAYLHAPGEEQLRRVFAAYAERFCFAGHTHAFGWHQQSCTGVGSREVRIGRMTLEADTRYLLLPGSVGQPRDPFGWHAKYLVWDQTTRAVDFRSVPYDVQTTIRLLGERGFPAGNAARLFR